MNICAKFHLPMTGISGAVAIFPSAGKVQDLAVGCISPNCPMSEQPMETIFFKTRTEQIYFFFTLIEVEGEGWGPVKLA